MLRPREQAALIGAPTPGQPDACPPVAVLLALRVVTGKMRASVSFGFGRENWAEAVDFVVEAEKLGVYSAWFAEAWG